MKNQEKKFVVLLIYEDNISIAPYYFYFNNIIVKSKESQGIIGGIYVKNSKRSCRCKPG